MPPIARSQSCLRLDNRYLIVNAGVIAGLLELQGFLVGFHCVIEELLQRILAANLEEVLGQAGLFGEPLILKVGRGQLGRVLAGAHCVAHLAPEIGLPRDIGGNGKELRLVCRLGCRWSTWTRRWKMFASGCRSHPRLPWENTASAPHAPRRALP